MPDRLDRVQIQFASVDEPIVISWDTRDELVDRLRLRADGATAVEAFRAVGASSPVRLTIDEKEQLLIVIDEWMCELGSGYLPDGVFDLRSALINDLRDADRGPYARRDIRVTCEVSLAAVPGEAIRRSLCVSLAVRCPLPPSGSARAG